MFMVPVSATTCLAESNPHIDRPGGKLNKNQDLGVKVATPIGTFVGQLLFGWLADVVGRKKMC